MCLPVSSWVEHLMGFCWWGFPLSTSLRWSEGWGLTLVGHARCWVLRGRALIASAFWSWVWLVAVPRGPFLASRLWRVGEVPPVL